MKRLDGPFQRCPSCGEWWPLHAFRVLRWFRVRRCEPCRAVGAKFARFINCTIWPLGVPDAEKLDGAA